MPAASRDEYHFSLRNAPEPLLVYDPETLRIVDASPGACALYGYALEELTRRTIEDIRDPGEVPALHRDLSAMQREPGVRRATARHKRADGSEFHADLFSHPTRRDGRELRLVSVRDVSLAQDNLAEIRRQALLFRTTADAVIFTDAEGRITDWNPAAERLWGYSREEALGRRPSALLRPVPGRTPIPDILAEAERDGVWTGTLTYEARDGAELVCRARVLALHNERGTLTGFIGVNTDQTREIRAKQALQASEEGFRAFADLLPHILWVAGPDGTAEFHSERWLRYTGQDAGFARGWGWQAALHPDDGATTEAAWRRAIESGDDFVVEHRLQRADGEYRWHLSRGTPIRDSRGDVVRWYGTTVDIHDQKATENALRHREEYFRGVFERAHDSIILFDQEAGRILDANPRAEELYGFDRSALRQLSLRDLCEEPDAIDGCLVDVRERGWASHHVAQKTRSGESILVEVNAALMQYGDRQVILAINRDLTERHQLERQLQQAQKMEAIGRLAGGLAHDFNNLITAIQGFAGLLREEIPEDRDSARDALSEIDSAASRASTLTRQLLAYTRQQVMRGRPLDLNEVVQSARQLLHRLIGEDIEIVLDLKPELATIQADPVQLQQVLMNLAVNARDAMPDGGRLRVETANVVLDDAFAAEHPPIATGAYVRLRVADTGHGMDAATLDHIFEPFFTTKPVGEGTGLGLATVYGTIKQSGGFIWADSTPGTGTTFDIFLPQETGEAREGDAAPAERGAAVGAAGGGVVDRDRPAGPGTTSPDDVGRGRTILLVEDEEGVRKLARMVLDRAGFRVLEAENGEEALALALDEATPIDLLVTDMVMPRMSGKRLAARVAEARPDLRIMFMSGYTGESLAERGDLTRTDVVLEKPFPPDALIDAVRRMLARQP